jgi:hypothetical protein
LKTGSNFPLATESSPAGAYIIKMGVAVVALIRKLEMAAGTVEIFRK